MRKVPSDDELDRALPDCTLYCKSNIEYHLRDDGGGGWDVECMNCGATGAIPPGKKLNKRKVAAVIGAWAAWGLTLYLLLTHADEIPVIPALAVAWMIVVFALVAAAAMKEGAREIWKWLHY